MNEKLEKFFSPSIKVKFLRGKISPDLVADHGIWRQFSRESGFGGGLYLPETAYDALLSTAGKHGYSFVKVTCEQ